ncbi:hypothetical protein QVM55_28075, partial [Pseudomonas monteilii]|uniref:hypothetical protein n=1 Tax=Pseudomonas monteilii TaxID=76759 RepID=UPI0035251E7F
RADSGQPEGDEHTQDAQGRQGGQQAAAQAGRPEGKRSAQRLAGQVRGRKAVVKVSHGQEKARLRGLLRRLIAVG